MLSRSKNTNFKPHSTKKIQVRNISCKCKAKVSMWSSKGLWEAQLFSTFATCFSGDSFTWEYRCMVHWGEFKGSVKFHGDHERSSKWQQSQNGNQQKRTQRSKIHAILQRLQVYWILPYIACLDILPAFGLHIVLTHHVPYLLAPSCPRRPPARTLSTSWMQAYEGLIL